MTSLMPSRRVNVLLDTVTFLWMVTGSERLSRAARQVLETAADELLLSTVSSWEISLKYALGKLPLPSDPAALIPSLRKEHGVHSLALGEGAALAVGSLPNLHNDPFDRMLVAQALTHDLIILTPDRAIRSYPVGTMW